MNKINLQIKYIGSDADKSDFVSLLVRTKFLRDLLTNHCDEILAGNTITVELDINSVGELITNANNFLKIEFNPSVSINRGSENLSNVSTNKNKLSLIISIASIVLVSVILVGMMFFHSNQGTEISNQKKPKMQENGNDIEITTNFEKQEDHVDKPVDSHSDDLQNSQSKIENSAEQTLQAWCDYAHDTYKSCYNFILDQDDSYPCLLLVKDHEQIFGKFLLKNGWDLEHEDSIIVLELYNGICSLGCRQAEARKPALNSDELCSIFKSRLDERNFYRGAR